MKIHLLFKQMVMFHCCVSLLEGIPIHNWIISELRTIASENSEKISRYCLVSGLQVPTLKTNTTHHVASQTKPRFYNKSCYHASHKSREQQLLQQQIKTPPPNPLSTCLYMFVLIRSSHLTTRQTTTVKHFWMPWQWYLARSSPNGCQWEGLKLDLDLSCPIPSISKVY